MQKLFIILLVSVVVVFVSCEQRVKKSSENLMEMVASDYSFPVEFNAFAPKDIDSIASDSLLVKFAWEHFLALNWKSSYNSNGKRDYPDTTWNWTQGDPELAVWETYAHRSELRPYSNKMLPFDDVPHYSYGDSLYPVTPETSFELFNNLDENNEIGSCDLYAHENIYGRANLVLYQAKVNRDEYNYILNNYPTKQQLLAAQKNGLINLPAGGDTATDGSIKTGAIEIKTAWRLLVKEDDPSKFFTRNVIYYSKNNDVIYYHNKTFALIGLHIIHKTKHRPDFVFATWEQVDVENDSMAFVLLKSGKETGKIHTNYKRFSPIPDLVKRANTSVHEQIKTKNTSSVWQNYRLVGVQGKPTNDKNSMSYYLANYVIESDPTLADFHGSSMANPHDNGINTHLNGKKYNMGGCMGCHGVAQRGGTDFSFLLDNVKKPIIAPDLLDSLNTDQIGKLEIYLEAYK